MDDPLPHAAVALRHGLLAWWQAHGRRDPMQKPLCSSRMGAGRKPITSSMSMGHLDRRADAAETVALIELEPIGDSCSFRL